MTKCECCEEEKDVTDVEGNLLCFECGEEIVRCHFCDKFLSISHENMEDNLGRIGVPKLFLPDELASLIFCNVDCLDGYIQQYKKEHNVIDKEIDKTFDISKLPDKWVIYLQKLDTFHKGFYVFSNQSDKLGVNELRHIVNVGRDALDEKVDELRDCNEDVVYQMFICTFRTFLGDEGVNEDIIKDDEGFREEFEGYIHWNIEKLFDFPVLLMETNKYEVKYNGIRNEIDVSVPEQKEFRDKVLKYIAEEQLAEILANTWDGSGFFGIIINGSDIIRAIRDNKNVVCSNDVVVGIYDGFNGSGYFKKVHAKEYNIDLDKAELDWGKYSLGAVFGNVEWIWK